MRVCIILISVVLTLGVNVACSRPLPTHNTGGATAVPINPAKESKTPKYESEMVHKHTINGETGSSSHKSTRYEGGKPFTAVEEYMTTLRVGTTTLKYELIFVGHRGNKDVYKLTYTLTKGENTEENTSEVSYEGKRTVVVEDQNGSLVLQPPSK